MYLVLVRDKYQQYADASPKTPTTALTQNAFLKNEITCTLLLQK